DGRPRRLPRHRRERTAGPDVGRCPKRGRHPRGGQTGGARRWRMGLRLCPGARPLRPPLTPRRGGGDRRRPRPRGV
ncbi:MAG: hypothetical protein AVDCRST_MAG19-1180, partial [uncultured Thermomicrobiales bacterium]